MALYCAPSGEKTTAVIDDILVAHRIRALAILLSVTEPRGVGKENAFDCALDARTVPAYVDSHDGFGDTDCAGLL